jgi:hypothetical protein
VKAFLEGAVYAVACMMLGALVVVLAMGVVWAE